METVPVGLGGDDMSDRTDDKRVIDLNCPCCAARLLIDAASGIVLESHAAEDPRKGADLKDAQRMLQEESSRVHDRYRRIVEEDKGRGAAMDKRFQEFLEKAKDEPAPRPVRDIDLD